MLLLREDLPVKVLSVVKGNEICYDGVILKKAKLLINYSYNPTKNNFENILVIGDLNISMEDNNMRHFWESYNLKSLIKVPTML